MDKHARQKFIHNVVPRQYINIIITHERTNLTDDLIFFNLDIYIYSWSVA